MIGNTVNKHIGVFIKILPNAVGPLRMMLIVALLVLSLGWQRPGGDPVGVSNDKNLGQAQIVRV